MIVLDILKLHKVEDTDPKSLILAEGKDLSIILEEILYDINKWLNDKEIINLILAKNNINIKLNNSVFIMKSEMNNILSNKRLTKNQKTKKLGMSGADFNKLIEGNYFPSCSKLKRIEKEFQGFKSLNIFCKNPDYCLQKFYLIYNSIKLKTNKIPLFVISELLILLKKLDIYSESKFKTIKLKLLTSIEYLICNQIASEKVKCGHYLDSSLSKILGSFCADGSLSKDYMIRWEEEHYTNMIALSNWLNDCFKSYEVKSGSRNRNSFTLKFRSKIISRYLTKLFDFKPGIKMYTTRAPLLIRKSDELDIKKSFAMGVMTFDGSANSFGNVSLSVCSEHFLNDTADILKDYIPLKKITQKSTKTGTLMYTFYTPSNLSRSVTYDYKSCFEPNTIKW